MKFLIYIISLLLPACGISQQLPVPQPGNNVVLATDTNKIDQINRLGNKSIETSKRDSAEIYAITAYYSSKKVWYLHGIAQALSLMGHIKTFFTGNLVEAEILDKASIAEHQKTSNQTGLDETYSHLAFVCFAQTRYDEALRYADTCYAFSTRKSDDIGISHNLQLLTQIYLKRGEFDKAFDAGQQGLQLNLKKKNKPEIAGCLLGLGSVCMGIEDYSLALNYYRSVFENFTRKDSLALVESEDLVWAKMEYAEIYSHLGRFDSALDRYNLFDSSGIVEKDLRVYLVSKGEYFLLRKEYQSALPNFLKGLVIHTKLNDGNEIVRTTLDIAETYFGLHQPDSALKYARNGLILGIKSLARQRMRDAYRILYQVFENRNRTDSAFFYYRKYVQTKESLTGDQAKGKFAAEEYVSKIALLRNEKKTNEQSLRFQGQLLKKQRSIRDILIALVAVILIVSLLLIRNVLLKRKNEKLINDHARQELIHKTNEMEMQALRAQMNPHFIFNCLNSINRFIMKNESQAASDYLTQFSRLIRLVLNNSKRAWIPLEEEIDMLKLYLDMEKLRFADGFDYELSCDDEIDTSHLFIPPMLLQPFVENAIWHGLMHKKGHGSVSISFRIDKGGLLCFIDDDGIGRAAAAKTNSKSYQKHRSLGIKITGERLALINRQTETNKVSFIIEDLTDSDGNPCGTRVCLKIHVPPQASVHNDSNPTLNSLQS